MKDKLDDFEAQLQKYNEIQEYSIIHVNTTFEILAETVRSVLDNRDYEMQDILDDHLNYCYNDSLIVVSDAWLWMEYSCRNNVQFQHGAESLLR